MRWIPWFELSLCPPRIEACFSGSQGWMKVSEAKVEVAYGTLFRQTFLKEQSIAPNFHLWLYSWVTWSQIRTRASASGIPLWCLLSSSIKEIGLSIGLMLPLTLTKKGNLLKMAGGLFTHWVRGQRLSQTFWSVPHWLTLAYGDAFILSGSTLWFGKCFDPSEP